jgi:hypothetical protein
MFSISLSITSHFSFNNSDKSGALTSSHFISGTAELVS